MSLMCRLVNGLLLLLYRKDALEFSRQMDCPDVRQQEKLLEILRKNEDTSYGRSYGFSAIQSVEEYRENVPLTDYEDYQPYIRRIGEGEDRVLTAERVKLFEITSGSVSASKLIPYTDSLRQEFQQGIKPWIWDLYTRYPQLRRGKSYWSITPAASQRKYTPAGIPIGFEEDTEYFGRLSQLLLDRVFVKPGGISQEQDMERFYFRTTLELLKNRELTLISIWNPTYLILLLDYMKDHQDQLLSALKPFRAKRIRDALARQDYRKIWPFLTVISCWGDGAAAGYVSQLQSLFPGTLVQPKGLLATEAFMTFPWGCDQGGTLSLNSHFFEFRSLSDGAFYSYSQLEQGYSYEVILTTSGGLYRYCIQDVVRAEGVGPGGLPLLRFEGKLGKVSDLFGEKLNELFLTQVLSLPAEEYHLKHRFFLAAPEGNRYVLYLEASNGTPDAMPEGKERLEEFLEKNLRTNFHYDYCRKLLQLQPLSIRHVEGDPREDYLRACVNRGQRLGDIKISVLSLQSGWEKVFKVRDEN